MADRVTSVFADLRARGGKGLMPFVTGGYPSLAATVEVLPALAEAGATAIEVGIPFSDPIADGPVIAGSMYSALSSGVDLTGVLRAVEKARSKTRIPLIAMVSASIVTKIGSDRFLGRVADAGFDGLIVPDLDLVEAPALAAMCDARQLALGLLVAPTTSDERLRAIVASCRGFVYLLARAGLTGEREGNPEVAAAVARVRAATSLPIAAGFGISTPAHVAAVVAHADAAIVGSAYVRRMGQADPVQAAVALTRELCQGLPSISSVA